MVEGGGMDAAATRLARGKKRDIRRLRLERAVGKSTVVVPVARDQCEARTRAQVLCR